MRDLIALWIENTDDEIKGHKAAAKFTGMSVSTMERLVREKKVSYLKHGKAISFSRKDLVTYKQRRRIKACMI